MRLTLILLLLLVASTAMISGIAMIASPDGSGMDLPSEILAPTPFESFFYPGLILALVVGGISLMGLYSTANRQTRRYDWALAAGIVLTGWIIGQVILLGFINWLHITYFAIGIFIFLLSWRLKGKWII